MTLPKTRPSITRDRAIKAATLAGLSQTQAHSVFVLAIRGYYRDSIGKPGVNDRNVYDDAAVIVFPETGTAGTKYHGVKTYNFNTDPSKYVNGIATLKTGIYNYRKGIHGISWRAPRVPYPAFRPATKDEQVPVLRDGSKVATLMGTAINIHKGGVGGTYSEGCQTLPPSQWDDFKGTLYALMDAYSLKTFPYALIDVGDFPEA